MTNTNFAPDYQKWWNKPDLTERELSILIFGINPDDFFRREKIRNTPGRSDEDILFLNRFQEHLQTPPYEGIWQICDLRMDLLNRKLWGNGKEDFVKNVYEQGMNLMGHDMHPDFYAFLEQEGTPMDHFDHYEDFRLYLPDWDQWDIQNIKDEDTAIALLMGLNPDLLHRALALHESLSENKTPDDRFFMRMFNQFRQLHFYGKSYLMGSVPEAIKSIKIWGGDFKKFAERLHDTGYIFRLEVYDFLKKNGCTPRYSKEGDAMNFCRKWQAKGAWTLEEAAALYIGRQPGTRDKMIFTDLRPQEPCVMFRVDSSFVPGGIVFFDKYGNEDTVNERFANDVSLEKYVERHIASGRLNPKIARDGSHLFDPKEIIGFLLEYGRSEPPPALLEALDMQDKNVTKTKNTPGRKPGDGAFDDSKHLLKMSELLSSGRAKSKHEAANIVAEDMEGASHESKKRRALKKFSETV